MAKDSTKNFSMAQYIRLQKYLMDLHLSGRACVFSELTGHIDTLRVSIRASKKEWMYTLFERDVELPREEHDWSPKNWKEYVDRLIEDIEYALSEREAKIANHKAEQESAERQQLEKLKAKYESQA